ncbi:SDR family oxidoreductase [Streptomyces sp. I05A-00742]|uniref:SDR family oxidoreductase n=1 Tax=Streptomyces sp. I05A-00742 TaxID=2732853 RepID=UPI001489141A|nr:SDR family oxidoreductase [Streptomyces sp. I05A-00742]
MSTRRAALVTGSSRGIGRAVAERLAADGTDVVVNYHADQEAAARVVDGIARGGGRAVAVRADATDPEELGALFDAAERAFGGLDVFVGNVGVSRFGPLARATDEDFDLHFTGNTRATFLALREAAGRLRDGGRIVVVSTGITRTHRPGAGVYAASKAACEAMTLVLARELGPRGITANCVLPGLTRDTGAPLTRELTEEYVSQTPLGRLGDPGDVADVVGFLASDAARWVTGQIVGAGGGRF